MSFKRNIRDAILFRWPYLGNFLEELELWHEIEEWCKEILTGPYTAADEGLYIYKKSDAVLYRMRWG